MGNILNVGTRALLANQLALQTAGNNIANVNTPGYSRQSVLLQNVEGQYSGNGYYGNGVEAATVLRHHSDYLTRQGYRITFHSYTMGHSITRPVLDDLRRWLTTTLRPQHRAEALRASDQGQFADRAAKDHAREFGSVAQRRECGFGSVHDFSFYKLAHKWCSAYVRHGLQVSARCTAAAADDSAPNASSA